VHIPNKISLAKGASPHGVNAAERMAYKKPAPIKTPPNKNAINANKTTSCTVHFELIKKYPLLFP
ncbi:hypothetical protein J8385_20565, partial [Acinetobacter baumannii]|nr:hypothetical protein [Acinetobacter baumannii]